MEREGWNQRHEATELVWTADPNQLLVAEVEALAPGTPLDLEGR